MIKSKYFLILILVFSLNSFQISQAQTERLPIEITFTTTYQEIPDGVVSTGVLPFVKIEMYEVVDILETYTTGGDGIITISLDQELYYGRTMKFSFTKNNYDTEYITISLFSTSLAYSESIVMIRDPLYSIPEEGSPDIVPLVEETLSKASQLNPYLFWGIAGVVVIVIGIVIYRKYKRT